EYAPASFVFVPSRSFLAPRVRTVVLPASRSMVIVNKTKIVNRSITVENNIVVNHGLSVDELRRATGRPVQPVPIERGPRLGPRLRREEIRIEPMRRLDGLRAAQPVRAGTIAAHERDVPANRGRGRSETNRVTGHARRIDSMPVRGERSARAADDRAR